jgi:hypothetical protein
LRRRTEQELRYRTTVTGLQESKTEQAVRFLRAASPGVAGGCDLLLAARLLRFQSNMRSFNRGLSRFEIAFLARAAST